MTTLRFKPFAMAGAAASALILASCGATTGSNTSSTGNSAAMNAAPGTVFDLSKWNITLPVDENRDDKPDTIRVKDIQNFTHPNFFYLDDAGRMVFTSPNKGFTTPNTSNARSELRYMLRGSNTKIKTQGPKNNMVVLARRDADKYGSIGGRMDATLRVDHVAKRANNPKAPAYSVVVGQIHATKTDNNKGGFGYGNEPLKIYYKKHPEHDTGSLFWTYELNLAKTDPVRKDIAYPVFGNTWENPADPGASGIALGEEFSYTVNLHENMMYLTFSNDRLGTKTYSKSLATNHDAYGKVDTRDNKYAYGGDMMYFKAGAYNQCSTADKEGFWYAACPGTGNWETDKANGDYTQVSFSKLTVGPSTPQ